MSRFRNRRNWNEFRWEKEIRRDERRINRYFAELPSCMDLPGEEDIIFGQIAESADLVPTGAGNTSEALRCWSYLLPQEEESDAGEEYSNHHPEQAVINLLDTLACQWNMAYVTTLPVELYAAGLSIACSYAKLLARMADFGDTGADANCDKGLHITLGKRTLADINELADALGFMAQNYDMLRELCVSHVARLGEIRDRVITLLGQSKKVK